jgi:hypothetical protein
MLRFKPVQRLWAILVVSINAVSILFLGTIEGKVIFVSWLLAGATMTLIYHGKGFVRLLGVAHAYWVPMIPWLAYRLLTTIPHGSWLRVWVVALIIINSLCLVIDAIDFIRYIRGERNEFYTM